MEWQDNCVPNQRMDEPIMNAGIRIVVAVAALVSCVPDSIQDRVWHNNCTQ